MEDDPKTAVTDPDDGDTGEQDTGKGKSAEELEVDRKKLIEENAQLKKRIDDKEQFINRQSSELGDLRKRVTSAVSGGEADTKQGKDELVSEVAADLMKKGQSQADAMYNAELLVEGSKRVFNQVRNESMLDEVADFIDDAVEDKTFDANVMAVIKDDVMNEFSSRKLHRTARKNFRMFKQCYKDVVTRRAEELRKSNLIKDEETRDGMISNASVSTDGTRKQVPDADDQKKERDAISGAGVKRNSTFF